MKKTIFKFLANTNKILFPSFTKRRLDMAKAKKWQLVIIGWRYFVTKNTGQTHLKKPRIVTELL